MREERETKYGRRRHCWLLPQARGGKRPTSPPWLGLLVFLALSAPAQAQFAPDPGLGKPVPMDGKGAALKGEAVTIELVSDAKTRAAVVEFLIRDFPLNGTLGPLVSHEKDRTRATVTYTPFQDTAATTDSFTYAARYPGGHWSRKAKFELTLETSSPIIHATTEIDFGKVMLGRSEEREIYLTNSGNASYRNQIRLAPPWTLEEPAKGLLHIPVGGHQTIKVRYTPEIEGPSTFHLAFYRNQGATSELKGAGFAPFSVQVEKVTLRWNQKSRTRIGTVSVTSAAPDLLPVTVATDERLQISGGGAVFLKPGEPAMFQIYLPATDVQPYAGNLDIRVGDFRVPVAVNGNVAPAYIIVENTATGEQALDFGPLEAGGIAQSSFQLLNAGGSAVKVKLSTKPPFSVLAAGGRATLDPQEAEAFAVRVTAPEGGSGPYEEFLQVEGDNGQTLRIGLRAVFLGSLSNAEADAALRMHASAPGISPGDTPPPPGAPEGNVPAPDRPPGTERQATQEDVDRVVAEMDELRSPLGFITLPTVERRVADGVPPVKADGLGLVEEGSRHLTIEWPIPADGYEDFEVEMRMLRQATPDSALESVWVPYNDISFSTGKGGKRVEAEIRGLTANSRYEFRVFTLGSDGEVSSPLAFVAKTTPPLDWTWIYISTGAVLLAGLGYLVWHFMGKPRPSRSDRRFPGYSRARDLIRGAD